MYKIDVDGMGGIFDFWTPRPPPLLSILYMTKLVFI